MLRFEYDLAERLSWCCVPCMRAHMTGDEFARWAARAELHSEAQESARSQARGQKPAVPHRTRTYRRGGRRR